MSTATKLAYSIKEAVMATGLSATHLDTAIRTGALRCRRTIKDDETGVVAGKRLILAADLQAYLDALPKG
jgi:hypothetical protein